MKDRVNVHPVPKALASHTSPKDLPWVPWAEGHFIKLIKLNPITGQIILFIRSVPGAALQMHFHPGTVVVYTVQGAWTYDEGWVSEAGDVVFEVAGSTHSHAWLARKTLLFLRSSKARSILSTVPATRSPPKIGKPS
jgi:2,4'-dihydroxyacetophenone dioxygenase